MYWQDFTEGPRRREALLSNVAAFIKLRSEHAQELDTALFRLAISTTNNDVNPFAISYHSVECWHVARSPQCTCIDTCLPHVTLDDCRKLFQESTIFQHARSRLVENRVDDVAKDALCVLKFFLSLSKTSLHATELSPFIPM